MHARIDLVELYVYSMFVDWLVCLILHPQLLILIWMNVPKASIELVINTHYIGVKIIDTHCSQMYNRSVREMVGSENKNWE